MNGPGQEGSDQHGAGTDILHLDMDSFFAAVEVLDDPSLRGRPVVVGGTGTRGVVASASYEARVFGVHSAMPTAEARRLCPHGVFLPGRFGAYAQVSAQMLDILRSVTPLVEPIAFDEAFLDVSGAHRLFGTSEEIARLLKARVEGELALPCAVGVGRSKLVAKLASKAAKPQVGPGGVVPGPGVVVVDADKELAFLRAHRVRALPGVGPATAERLGRLGVSTVADLAQIGEERLVRLLGRSHGAGLAALARGEDRRLVEADRTPRSIGHEETFERDDDDLESLKSRLRELAVSVATRCRSASVLARTVSVKVKFGDFSSISRARTLAEPFDTAARIAAVGCELLDTVDVAAGVRLLGVHVSSLEARGESRPEQLELFALGATEGPDDPERTTRAGEVELATDEIRRRFGSDSIGSVASAGRGIRRPPGPAAGV